MKTRVLTTILSLGLALLGVAAAKRTASADDGPVTGAAGIPAATATAFSNTGSITVGDRPAGGNPAKATPYSSDINVSGLSGTVTKVTVTLTNINHTFPDDLDVLLVGPGGENCLVMSDVGGGRDLINTTVTLDQTAALTMPDDTLIDNGTYKPTNLAGNPALEENGLENMPFPAPGWANYNSNLNVFNGTDPSGTWQLYITDDENGDFGTINGGWSINITAGSSPVAAKPFDFDGDGKADVSVFRGSAGDWYRLNSSNNGFVGQHFGATGDRPVPADFDGDGKTDVAIFRPSTGAWYWINSGNNTLAGVTFGQNGDLPVPADFDGDGKADIAVFRASAVSWYRLNSSNGQFVATQFGIFADKPAVGDFDGDGKADISVFRASSGDWYRLNSSDGQLASFHFGANGDKAVPANYDGDTKTDIAVFRPTSGDWYVINSSTGALAGFHFGANGDIAAPADFDGDGKADLTVFRPSAGAWYLQRTTAGFAAQSFGINGDTPLPNAYVY
jgi:subtilisin-like proprotein convertase family protein